VCEASQEATAQIELKVNGKQIKGISFATIFKQLSPNLRKLIAVLSPPFSSLLVL
jgi:hypothetical protein